VASRFVTENLPIPAARGNLYDSEGHLLAGSVPEYRLYMDYVVIDPNEKSRIKTQAFRDSVFTAKLDSICMGLARIFPDKTEEFFRQRLLEGKRKGSHAWRIYPYNATYIQYMECKELPLFRESVFKGGFRGEKIMQRKHPYGSLAKALLGDLYRDTDAAKGGLEMSYDSILRGTNGVSHRMKVRNQRISFVDQPPVDGNDLVTTLDINMQDAAEKALRKMIREIGAETGVCILMEVATGDIKAMVNLTRDSVTTQLEEVQNFAIGRRYEPGSVFKTVTLVSVLSDGYVKTLDETLAYMVLDINTVLPEDTSKLTIDPNRDSCTLVTCTPYGVNTHRLLVRGERIEYTVAAAAVEDAIIEELPASTWTQEYLRGIGVGLMGIAALTAVIGAVHMHRNVCHQEQSAYNARVSVKQAATVKPEKRTERGLFCRPQRKRGKHEI
jgi:LPXTG-site transpeptidase (sortase) family protein